MAWLWSFYNVYIYQIIILHLKHTHFILTLKKGTNTSNDCPFYPRYTCHFYSIHFSQKKQKCFCACTFLVRPLFFQTLSLQLEFNGHLIYGAGTQALTGSGCVKKNEKWFPPCTNHQLLILQQGFENFWVSIKIELASTDFKITLKRKIFID